MIYQFLINVMHVIDLGAGKLNYTSLLDKQMLRYPHRTSLSTVCWIRMLCLWACSNHLRELAPRGFRGAPRTLCPPRSRGPMWRRLRPRQTHLRRIHHALKPRRPTRCSAWARTRFHLHWQKVTLHLISARKKTWSVICRSNTFAYSLFKLRIVQLSCFC